MMQRLSDIYRGGIYQMGHHLDHLRCQSMSSTCRSYPYLSILRLFIYKLCQYADHLFKRRFDPPNCLLWLKRLCSWLMDDYKLYLKCLIYTHRGGRCGHDFRKKPS